MNNIGKIIQDFYCNGFAGRRYDLFGSLIESEGQDYIVLRLLNGEPVFIDFSDVEEGKVIQGWKIREKQILIDQWVTGENNEE